MVLEVDILVYSDMFRMLLQKCLDECKFLEMYKIQKLLLLSKSGKLLRDSPYLNICYVMRNNAEVNVE